MSSEQLKAAGVQHDRGVVPENRLQGESSRGVQGVEGKQTEPREQGRGNVETDKRLEREHEEIKGEVSRNIRAEKADLGQTTREREDEEATLRQKQEEGKIRSPVRGETDVLRRTDQEGGRTEDAPALSGPKRDLTERIVDVGSKEKPE
jgi:hypothetical protein